MHLYKNTKNIVFVVKLKNKIFFIEISKRLYKMHLNNLKVFNTKWLLKNAIIHVFHNK